MTFTVTLFEVEIVFEPDGPDNSFGFLSGFQCSCQSYKNSPLGQTCPHGGQQQVNNPEFGFPLVDQMNLVNDEICNSCTRRWIIDEVIVFIARRSLRAEEQNLNPTALRLGPDIAALHSGICQSLCIDCLCRYSFPFHAQDLSYIFSARIHKKAVYYTPDHFQVN
jgi:hypothetical protein